MKEEKDESKKYYEAVTQVLMDIEEEKREIHKQICEELKIRKTLLDLKTHQ